MMKFIKPFTYVMMAGAACISVWFVGVIKPTGVGAFVFFAAWLVAPYLILTAALIMLSPKGRSPLPWFALATLVAIAGMLLLADVIFWHADAQGAIAVLMVPLLQYAGYAVLLPLALWISRKAQSRRSNS